MRFSIGTTISARPSTVRRESLPVWAKILHDPNPIHLDAALVRALGLGEAEINQGPANLAFVIDALADAFPGGRIDSLDIRFVGNVFAGETVVPQGTIVAVDRQGADERATLDIALAVGDRIVLKGSAMVRQPAQGAVATPEEAPMPAPPVDPALLRSTEDTAQLDWAALWRHLSQSGLPPDPRWQPRQFAGGYGNLNYLIRVADQWAVLRRPPFGAIPRGANDMEREHRVLGVLAPAWALVPRSLHYCPEPAVIGAHFLVTEFRAGLPLHGPRPLGDAMTGEKARYLSAMQIDVLAHLHRLDVAAIGAGNLGRPDGFAARTLRGWAQRLEGAGGAPASARALFARLNEARPADRRACVIHNDFKLDNVVVDPETLAPRAVLDWDMATLGSPFFDLATLLSYWVQPTDPAELHGLNHTHSLAPGAMTRRELADRYLTGTGFGTAADERDLRFFLALAFAKLGTVYLQLHRRFQADPESNRRYERFGAVVPGVFELGLAATAGELL